MYIARFDTSDEEWIQVAVLVDPTPSFGTAEASAFWDVAVHHFSILAQFSRGTIARRVSVGGERRLRQVLIVTAPAEEERPVRQAVAALTRLERMAGGKLAIA